MTEQNQNLIVTQYEGHLLPLWVKEMHEHYRDNGFYRAEDVQRVLGDPRECVEVKSSTDLMQFARSHTNQEDAMLKETETQTRLRRATDALAIARRQENAARRALAQAVQSTARAKEKFSELLNKLGQEECALQMTDYR